MYDTYLEKAWGDSIDHPTIDDVKTAIEELKQMDDEHGSFWVCVVYEFENILEVDKELSVIAVLEGYEGLKIRLKSWDEVIAIYKLLLDFRFDQVRQLILDYSLR